MQYKHSIKVDYRAIIRDRIRRIAPNKNICRMLAAIVLSVIVSVVSLYSAGVRVSYDVIFEGEKIAHIDSIDVYKAAKNMSLSEIITENSEQIRLAKVRLKPVLSFKTEKTTVEALSTSILENSSSVSSAFAVALNDTDKIYVNDKTSVEQLINQRLHSFDIEGLECQSQLADKLEFRTVYLDNSMLSTETEIENLVNNLNVITTATSVTTYETPYKTVYKETSSKYQGYSAVTTKGVNGVNKVTKTTKYLNGVVAEEPTVTDVRVTEVVDKVITTGTGSKPSASFTAPVALDSYLWPVNVPWRITSYWGDSRGHKGLDIARSYSIDSIHGADILASKSGTVTKSRYNGGYGYMVEIDHGDGTKTRYAHCSKLIYKEGSYVTRGTVIAKVGNSGNSSGPHLHFEILVNGTQVNPENYFVLR